MFPFLSFPELYQLSFNPGDLLDNSDDTSPPQMRLVPADRENVPVPPNDVSVDVSIESTS